MWPPASGASCCALGSWPVLLPYTYLAHANMMSPGLTCVCMYGLAHEAEVPQALAFPLGTGSVCPVPKKYHDVTRIAAYYYTVTMSTGMYGHQRNACDSLVPAPHSGRVMSSQNLSTEHWPTQPAGASRLLDLTEQAGQRGCKASAWRTWAH
jgi:hypothetical protein